MAKGILVGTILLFGPILTSFASDSLRLDFIDKEIRELKIRVSDLESRRDSLPSHNGHLQVGTEWEPIAKWRNLKTGMSPKEVRGLLGEPLHVRSSVSTTWNYPKNGKVEFLGERLFGWDEPE